MTHTSALPKVGFIGLGAMGEPMAQHLARAGYLSAIWNRTVEKAVTLAGVLDVSVSESPAALARDCDLVITCVALDEDLRGVVEAMAGGLRPGFTLVDTSTVSPSTAREVAASLAEKGAAFADAPVSGGVEGARNGKLSVMVGADSATFSRIRPVLDCFAARVTHLGPPGSGQATKAVNQVMVAGIAEAVSEALLLAEQQGLPAAELVPVLGAGAAGNWFLAHRGQTMLANDFATGFKQSLLLKDLRICRELARELNISLSVLDQAIPDYQRLVEAGFGDDDISGLLRLKRQQAAEG